MKQKSIKSRTVRLRPGEGAMVVVGDGQREVTVDISAEKPGGCGGCGDGCRGRKGECDPVLVLAAILLLDIARKDQPGGGTEHVWAMIDGLVREHIERRCNHV